MEQIKRCCVWNAERILRPLSDARREQGIFSEQIATLTQTDLLDAQMQALAREVTGTLALEGEEASYESIHSLVTRRLCGKLSAVPEDPRAFGVVEVLLDVTRDRQYSIDGQRFRYWHSCLEREAPDTEHDVSTWLQYYRAVDGLLRSAIAHVSFPAGGLVQRAVAVMALAQDDVFSQRYLSLSEQFARKADAYRDALQRARGSPGDITAWLVTCLDAYVEAIRDARTRSACALRLALFSSSHPEVGLSDRQVRVLSWHLRTSHGLITARTWAAMTATSIDTAERDLRDLLAKRVIVQNPPKGKKTSYVISRGREGRKALETAKCAE